jgi:hypothetical protein
MQSVTGDEINFKQKLEMPAELVAFDTWTTVTSEGEASLKGDHNIFVMINGAKPVKPANKRAKKVSKRLELVMDRIIHNM